MLLYPNNCNHNRRWEYGYEHVLIHAIWGKVMTDLADWEWPVVVTSKWANSVATKNALCMLVVCQTNKDKRKSSIQARVVFRIGGFGSVEKDLC